MSWSLITINRVAFILQWLFRRNTAKHRAAFSLVEMLVALAVLAVIILLIASMTQLTSSAWRNSQAQIEAFQGARTGFEAMTRRLSEATLNSYFGYTYGNGTSAPPTSYSRQSELHFICGKSLLNTVANAQSPALNIVTQSVFFQAPMGYTVSYNPLDGLLNGCGYYIQYGNDTTRPSFLGLPNRYRFRLMQFFAPSEQLQVYDTSGAPASNNFTNGTANSWFINPLTYYYPLYNTSPPSNITYPMRQMAENIVALIIYPKLSEADLAKTSPVPVPPTTTYEYDSRNPNAASSNPANSVTLNQLPPVVEVVMVAIDEPSAIKICASATMPNLDLPSSLPSSTSTLFQSIPTEASLENDLATLESVLNAAPGNPANNKLKLNYHVFRSEVPIRAAKYE